LGHTPYMHAIIVTIDDADYREMILFILMYNESLEDCPFVAAVI